MAFYDEMSDLAVELISEFGADVTLQRATQAAPADPDAPWVVQPVVDSPETVKAVFLEWDQAYGTTEFLAANQTAMMVLVAAADTGLTAAPTLKDEMTDAEGARWVIHRVSPLRPAGSTLLYQLAVAR